MDIVGSLAAAGQALDIVKKLREIDDDLKSAEVRLQLAELYANLAEVKMALADAQTELKAKDGEIARLKEVNDGKLRTFMHNGYRFGIDDAGTPLARAFCPACLANGQQIIISRGIGGHDLCPKCSGTYSSRDVTLPPGFKLPDAAS